MASGQNVWGIDLGKCALKALKLRPAADGQLEVVAHDYIEHAKILTQPDADRDTLIANALEKFLSHNDITGDKVVVSVPGQHTLARFSKLPPVDAKKIPDLVHYEADQQIPFDMEEVVWDYQIFHEEDTPEIEVGIFAMKRALVRDYLLHFEASGIEPVVVQSAPLALYNAAYHDGLLDTDTTVLIDIGAENTDLVVATKHHLWTRTIPLGGNNFTDALVKSFKLSFPKAENLKRTAASSKYARQIFQAMRPIFADMVQELQRSIGFYTSTHRDATLGRVVGMGNAFKLPGLEKYLQQNLQLPLVRPESFKMLATGATASAPQFTEQLSSFAVAYGLCVQGLDLATISTSLLPSEIARQLVWSKKKPFFIGAAACLALAAGTIWFRQSSDNTTLARGRGNTPRQVKEESDADSIIRSGPGNLPPREYAAVVLNAADALKRLHGDMAAKGKDEEAQIDQVLKLLGDRALPLRLIELIHAALPAPLPELELAQTPEALAAAIRVAGDKLARPSRKEIYIESLTTRFYPELDVVVIEDHSGAEQPDAVAPKDTTYKGFVVRVRCRTPFSPMPGANIKFMLNSFIQNLRTRGRQPGQGFYVNRVAINRIDSATQSAASPSGEPESTRGPTTVNPRGGGGGGKGGGGNVIAPMPGGGKGGGGGGPGRGGPSASGKAGGDEGGEPTGGAGSPMRRLDRDPVTGEPTKDDSVFYIWVEVVLGELPAAPDAAAGQPEAPGGRRS